ncbi:MAG: thioredoxin TrxC [Epsilonproteobacteria bacterium]|nr:MAG: thioredoxin TrxC [Campylobacterota bacterium]
MEKVKVVCPHCGAVNAIPKKDQYAKANCGQCKKSLLDTKPINLNETSFNNQVVNSDIPIVVDFWAEWCGPCKMMAPAFEQTAKEFALKARFAKVDTETEQMVAGRFGIRSIPTMIMFKNNKELDRVSGALSAEQLKQWISQHL